MTDVFDARTRSRVMAAIGSKNTAPEVLVRKFLHSKGFRFKLHVLDLPGRPDIVLPGRRVALFVHGCFWHQHRGCALAAVPASNSEFWKKKLFGNCLRDARQIGRLREQGWRVGVFWECAARKGTADIKTLHALERWLNQRKQYQEFPIVPFRKARVRYVPSRIR
jgi:DNA mismatch endonuclease (patch repair protein)